MLNKLFMKYKCDKSTKHHHYVTEYESHLAPIKEDPINILEIGVWKGTSLSAFHEYLPNANVYGVDVFTRVSPDDVPILKEDRVHWMKADSTKKEVKEKVLEKWPGIKFDVIIDDGLHTPEANQKTFENFIEFLKDDGVYYIEDAWPIDIMTSKELKHNWILKNEDKYNMLKMLPFLNTIEKYNVERIDLRKTSKLPDSYIFKITNESRRS